MNQKTATIIIAPIAIFILVFFLARAFVGTTTDITIKNDTSNVVTVSGCAPAAQTAQPAEQIDIHVPKTHTNAANCAVRLSTGAYLGCLSAPTTSTNVEVSVTAAKPAVAEKDCTTGS